MARKASSKIESSVAFMNFAIRNVEADIGKEHIDTFRHDLHVEPHLSASYNYGKH